MNVEFCVVIPCYNHGAAIAGVLRRLAIHELPCFIVDDGSNAQTRHELEALNAQHPELRLLRLEQNQGKGGAVLHGLEAAWAAGYTHALQIDADGQHQIEDIPLFLAEARRHPDALLSGKPVYDASIPRSRLYGRYITHAWVWIETLSLRIQDAMCGFRVYPLAATLRVARATKIGRRMDFDPEIMVRLYWAGTESRFIPTRVVYPQGGVSHFHAFKDNLRISWMHTRLVFGMLYRLPRLLFRRPSAHWAERPELKGVMGMRIMMLIYRAFGRRTFELLLWPVVGVYWLMAGPARRASRQWLARVRAEASVQGIILPEGLNSYRHFLRFAHSMLDKIASWRGELLMERDVVFAPGARQVLDTQEPKGRLILGAHLGDMEACRALAQLAAGQTINALVFTDNAQRFNRILNEFSPKALINLISVKQIGPETAIVLQQKLDAGEWVAIMGDRLAVGTARVDAKRIIWSEFLGEPAPFSAGPFILAATLRCPVTLLFALRQGKRLQIHCEPFTPPALFPRTERLQSLQAAVDRYAQRLAHHAIISPLDWFNFFDFWHLPESRAANRIRRDK